MIIDNFSAFWGDLRDYADTATFEDVTNEADGVVYPGICRDIPIADEITRRLSIIKGSPVERVTMFMRLSPEGVHVPHQAHTDNSMGDWSLMLYMNRAEHCQGGTSLIRHKPTGIAFAPENSAYLDVVQSDQNTPQAWQPMEMATMAPNRAFIFNANAFHRAEPVGGFGTDKANARLVLTAFFS